MSRMFLRDSCWLNKNRPHSQSDHYFHVLRIISPKLSTIPPVCLLVDVLIRFLCRSKILQIMHLLLKAIDTDHSHYEPRSDSTIIPYLFFLIMLPNVTGARGTVIFDVTFIPVYQQRPELIFAGRRRYPTSHLAFTSIKQIPSRISKLELHFSAKAEILEITPLMT